MMASTFVTKGKTKKFFQKLFDSDKDEQSPPKPLSNLPVSGSYSVSNPIVSNHDLIQSFNALALSRPPRPHPESQFIGGFKPGYISTNDSLSVQTPSVAPFSPGPLPRPPAMPIPHSGQQSLTMQMALRPSDQHLDTPSLRPHSTSALLPPSNDSASTTLPSVQTPRPNSAPVKPNRPRAASTPTSSYRITGSQQCSGVTKAGKRCARQVKSGPALSRTYDDDGNGDADSPSIERFCFQHTKELLGPTGYYSRKNGDWVDFADWIPTYLQSDTQASLRVEMEKSRSPSDVPGYIYTFEIRDLASKDTIKLKVGRAVNLVKRIDQWGKQCGSKEQVLRGWYPGTVEPDDTEGSLMKGRVKAGDKGAWCHRMERLVHLELAELAATGVYLSPGWPDVIPVSVNGTSTTSNMKNNTRCTDCGTMHKEIFEFRRLKGRFKGKEWEIIVQPVIERWGKFVNRYV